jgi:hypothetical protein
MKDVTVWIKLPSGWLHGQNCWRRVWWVKLFLEIFAVCSSQKNLWRNNAISSSNTFNDASVNIWRHGKIQVNTDDFRRDVKVIFYSSISAFHRVDVACTVLWIVTLSTRNTVPARRFESTQTFLLHGSRRITESHPTFLNRKPVRFFETSEINNPGLPRNIPDYPNHRELSFSISVQARKPSSGV